MFPRWDCLSFGFLTKIGIGYIKMLFKNRNQISGYFELLGIFNHLTKFNIYPSFLVLSKCVLRIETIHDHRIIELQTSLGWKGHLKLIFRSILLQWAETSSTISGCSEVCPIWLRMFSGMAHLLPGMVAGTSWQTYIVDISILIGVS